MRQSHLILSNAAIIWMARVLVLVPQLIFVPYLIGTIGEDGYGTYALVWSLMISIEQLQNSLQSGVVKYCAGFLALDRMDDVNRVVSSSFVYSIMLAVLTCAGTLVTAMLYNGPSDSVGFALFVVAVMVLFVFPLTPYIAVIQSRQRYYIGTVIDAASKYLSLLVVVMWFQLMEPSVKALILIMAGILFISRLIQVPVAYRLVPGLRNYPRLFDRESFRLVAAFGAATVLASLCLVVNSTGIRWLMDALVSAAFVAHLAIMLMPGLLLSQVIEAVTITVMPATSAYHATGDQRMLQELLIRGVRYTTILGMVGLLTAGLLMKSILSIWVGVPYVFLAPFAFALFASMAFLLSTSIAHHMLKGMGALRIVVLIYSSGLVVVPIGLIIAVFDISGDPYIAVTIALATGHLLTGALNVGFCGRMIHVDLFRLAARAYIQPSMVMVAVCLLAIGIVTIGDIDGLVGRICIAMFATLVYFVGCYLIIFSELERQQAKEIVQLIKHKITKHKTLSQVN